MKPVTLNDYENVADEFFSKYHFVAKELGEGCKSSDVLKVMEAMSALVIKKRADDRTPFGFNKDEEEDK